MSNSSLFLSIEVFSAGFGAWLGFQLVGIWGGVIGASVGALINWLLKVILEESSENSKLKRKILTKLNSSSSIEVRDLIQIHGYEVPTDCFIYDNKLPYIKILKKYRKALTQLEAENHVVGTINKSYGLVDPPNQWVNEFSGRAYKKI
ncbi:MAG: hypothetical protein VKK07_12215 [Merismopediaceae bacterium]|nr:hypothetical protein [Merismopediaceae bacterium]